MAQSIEAIVTPSVMKWARERARLDISAAAKCIGRTEEEIEQWEKDDGTTRPTISQLRKAAEAYKSALAVFFLPEPPEGFQVLRDFRRLPAERNKEYSTKLALLIRTVDNRRNWLSEWRVASGEQPLDFIGTASIDSDPSSIAGEIRSKLSISIDDQLSLRSRREALKFWADRVEDIGINVCLSSEVDLEEARGFTLIDSYAPFVWVNSSDAKVGSIFTIAHELAHIWLNATGISNLESAGERINPEDERIEVFCNAVAGLVVLNEYDFANLWNETNVKESIDNRIIYISDKAKVSEEVVARRLLIHGVIDDAQYNALRKGFIERWRILKDIEKEKMKESEYGPPPHLIRVIKNGRTFSRTVLIAYYEGKISGLEASHLLNWKINNFPKMAKSAGMQLTEQIFAKGEVW